LRRVLDEPLTNGLFKTKDQFGEGTPLVNVSDVYAADNLITAATLERVKANRRDQISYQVRPGDIFFVRSSLKLEGTGVSSMMPEVHEQTVFECHVVRGRPRTSVIDPGFLIRYLNAPSVRDALVAEAKTVTMSTLDQQAFLRLPILVPPMCEQEEMIESLKARFASFNSAKSGIDCQIQSLKALRSTLIAHAVTGRIQVA
jgi:type I restriction enzyme S subunit